MNCPTCGAENDANARFCAECGTPLDNQEIDATVSGQIFEPDDNDMTILSTAKDLATEAKTMAVGQADVADFLASAEPETPPEPAAPSPPQEPAAEPAAPDFVVSPLADSSTEEAPKTTYPPPANGGSNKKKLLIIGGIVFVVLALSCCCCSAAIGGVLSDPQIQEDILRELGSLALTNLMV